MNREAQQFATKAHTGQKYGDEHPYVKHLQDVVKVLEDRVSFDRDLIAIAWLHDVLEDTPTSVDDLRDAGFNETIIAAVRLCTDEPGHNRRERKAATNMKIQATPLNFGHLVKAADRLANIQNCIATKSNLLSMYRKEGEAFLAAFQKPLTDGHGMPYLKQEVTGILNEIQTLLGIKV